MKVSVNLVTWNGARYILDCLQSVFAQTYTDFSVLIIDNNSTDETVAIINEQYPHLQIVQNRENFGFAKAHNQAIHWSKSEYVLVLNQDVILEPGYIENLVAFLDKFPDVGACTGKIYRFESDQKTKYIDTVGLQLMKNFRVVDRGAGEVDEGQYDVTEEVFGVSGAIPLYRRVALQSVQEGKFFFDEDFGSYKEDVDLAFRLRYAGWKAYMVPAAIAYHERTVAAPLKEMTRRMMVTSRKQHSSFSKFYSYRNHWYVILKNIPEKSLHYRWPIFWYEVMKFLYILFAEPRLLKVVGEVWRNRKKFDTKRQLIVSKRKIQPTDIDTWFTT